MRVHTISHSVSPRSARNFAYPPSGVLLLRSMGQERMFTYTVGTISDIVTVYLPSFTTRLGYSSGQGALVLALANLAQILGEVGFGLQLDHVNGKSFPTSSLTWAIWNIPHSHETASPTSFTAVPGEVLLVHVLVVVSTATADVLTSLLWGCANNLAMLIVFALLFGTSGAGSLALWARVETLFGEEDAPMVYGVLCCTRGIGSIASGPISLMELNGETVRGIYGAGRYKSLLLFVGLCLTISSGLGSIGLATTIKAVFGRQRSEQKHTAESVARNRENK